MYFERFYETSIAQASFLIGCQATGEALVIDPVQGPEHYVAAAAAQGLRVTRVTETHIHADFVSGARALAARAGAQLYLSAEGGDEWQYGYAADAGATLLHDGDRFQVGRIRIDVLHTPGHTPEHLSFMVTDTARGDQPVGVVTGDFVFVGDVGRPDLLERAAGQAGTMEDGARTLYASVRRFATLPDFLQLWPGHGAGSACGKALGAMPQTTLGYERLFNWALATEDESTFVRAVLDGQPEVPAYFAVMKRVNRDGPALVDGAFSVRQLPAEALGDALSDGLVVDTRAPERFAAGHVAGSVNVPRGNSFATRVASLLPYDRPVFLLAEPDTAPAVDAAARQLVLVGVDGVAGWFDSGALEVWAARHDGLERTPQMEPAELAAHVTRGDVAIVDVRGRSEWLDGHLAGAHHVLLSSLVHDIDQVRALADGKTLVIHCQGGARSAIAASLLQARGVPDVVNLTGGFAAWRAAGLPVGRGANGSA